MPQHVRFSGKKVVDVIIAVTRSARGRQEMSLRAVLVLTHVNQRVVKVIALNLTVEIARVINLGVHREHRAH